MRLQLIILALALAMPGAPSAQQAADLAVTPGEKGRAIAVEAERRYDGFGDSVVDLSMTLSNEEGRERTRRLTWKTLEVDLPGEGDKSLTIFHEPRDIEGTAFLTHTHTDRDDDQWLYLPSLKRVKRIASANKSSAFVGSEFAYEDLLSDEVEKFDFLWLLDEACGEWQCHVVQRVPRYRDSGYTRQVLWIDQVEFRPMRIDYYDHKSRLLKSLAFEDYRLYRDRFWRSHQMRMNNVLTRKQTTLTFGDFEFRSGLNDRDFDPSALRQLR